MSKPEKLIKRFCQIPKDFTWDELVRILSYYGYEEKRTGKTGGSRRKFADEDNNIISLHKPHPSTIVKTYILKDVLEHLINNGKLKNDE